MRATAGSVFRLTPERRADEEILRDLRERELRLVGRSVSRFSEAVKLLPSFVPSVMSWTTSFSAALAASDCTARASRRAASSG